MEEEIEEIEEWEKCGEGERCTYYVSNLGQVKSISKVSKRERILKGNPHRDGYLQVRFCNKTILIHRLVAYAFIGPRPKGLQIDHEDRNKHNNNANNLKYCTPSENGKNKDYYRDDILEIDPKERHKVLSKEYREANHEEILKYQKEYREANRETILQKQKKKYTCECGIELMEGSRNKHEKSKKHLKFLNNSINKDEKEINISNGRKSTGDPYDKI